MLEQERPVLFLVSQNFISGAVRLAKLMAPRAAFIVWMICILALSVIPVSQPDLDMDQSDKMAHFLMYAGTTAVCYPVVRRIGSAALLSFSLGFMTEIVQYFLPWRSFSLWDVAANGAGALAAYLWIRAGWPVPKILRLE